MSQRKTVTCPNPDVLAQAVAVRVLTTIRNLLAEPGRSRVDIALTGGTDGNRVLRAIGTDLIRAGKGHRLTFALITLMENYSNTKPRERRFSLGVCTRTQRLIQSQDKSSFQPYQTADCMFCGGSHYRLAAFLSAQLHFHCELPFCNRQWCAT